MEPALVRQRCEARLVLPDQRVVPLDACVEVDMGRAPDTQVHVADDPRVSRRHARLWWRERGWWFEDLRSAMGTTLNGVRAASGWLAHGDVLLLGNTAPRFEEREAWLPWSPPHVEQMAAGLDIAGAWLRYAEWLAANGVPLGVEQPALTRWTADRHHALRLEWRSGLLERATLAPGHPEHGLTSGGVLASLASSPSTATLRELTVVLSHDAPPTLAAALIATGPWPLLERVKVTSNPGTPFLQETMATLAPAHEACPRAQFTIEPG